MSSIKRLITHGCSYTYGEELDDPFTQSWPAMLSKQLGTELVNLAQCAYSNDGIVQDIVTFDLREGDFVIVCWTHNHRLLFVDDDGWFTTLPNFVADGDFEKNRELITTLLLTNISNDWLYERWLTQVILLQTYLKNKNIPFLFFNAFGNVLGKHKLIDSIDKSKFMEWDTFNFCIFSNDYPLCPKLHPNADAHSALADKLIKNILL